MQFAFELLEALEMDNCSGVEQKNLFYYSREFALEVGIPKEVCSEEMLMQKARRLMEDKEDARLEEALKNAEQGAIQRTTINLAMLASMIVYLIF